MLNIRAEQMHVFERDALRRFEDEMIDHSREFLAPALRGDRR